jgi:hypothetical protein
VRTAVAGDEPERSLIRWLRRAPTNSAAGMSRTVYLDQHRDTTIPLATTSMASGCLPNLTFDIHPRSEMA